MSRSSPGSAPGMAGALRRDVLRLELHPERLELRREGGLWRRRIRHAQAIPCAPAAGDTPAWQPPLQALLGELSRGALAGAQLRVVLSNHFAHYVLVPWNELLRGEQEQLAYARQRVLDVHGSGGEGWSIRLSRAGVGEGRVACAVSQALIDALEAALSPLGGRYRSLQPQLMDGFNRWRARIGRQPAWFVQAEPGLACLALLDQGAWHRVRTVRLGGAEWPRGLLRLLAREQLLDGAPPCRRVLLQASSLPPIEAADREGWHIDALQPAAPADVHPAPRAPISHAHA